MGDLSTGRLFYFIEERDLSIKEVLQMTPITRRRNNIRNGILYQVYEVGNLGGGTVKVNSVIDL
tara:strand:+ start:1132 stop:1323 length:192 start_codon:yes stop_codon:yes gene_type:complete